MLDIKGGKVARKQRNVYYISNVCSNYKNCSPISIKFSPGFYKIECWGASSNARGAYVSGKIQFFDNIELF